MKYSKIYTLLILIFFVTPIDLRAQDDKLIDSLENDTHSKIDTIKAKALFNLSFIYSKKYDSTVQKSTVYADELLTFSETANSKLIKVLANLAKGRELDARSKFIEAVEFYRNGRMLAEELGRIEYILRCGMGEAVILKEKGDYKGATDLLYKLLELSEKSNNIEGRIISLSNIANIYNNKGETEKAIEMQHEIVKIDKELNDSYGLSIDYNNIASIYFESEQSDSAYIYFHKALKLKREVGDVYGAAITMSNLGKYFVDEGKLDSALYYLEISLKDREELNDILGLAWTHTYLGEYYTKAGNLNQAEWHFEKGLVYSAEMESMSNTAEIYEEQSKMYARFNQYDKAYDYVNKYYVLKDSLLNKENLKDMANLEFKYQTEKKVLEIENLKKDQVIKDAELQNEKEINQEKTRQQYLAYAAMGFFILFGIAALTAFIRKKKDNKIISEQKSAVEKQKNQIEEQKHMLEEKNQEIIDSINYAKRIQSAILPQQKTIQQYLPESFVLYKPKDIVAGDFYWMEHVENTVLIAAADCTGHGVPGAMVSVICNNGLNKSVHEHQLVRPGDILDKTRELVISEFSKSEEQVKDGMDIALCSIIRHDEGATVEYSGAHNPLWIIRKGTQEIEEIKASKQPIGNSDHFEPFATNEIKLQKGDVIYIFSDGYADQFGGDKGKKFKAANFKSLLISVSELPMEDQKKEIDQTFEAWRGSIEQLDDVCVIGVRI